MQRAEPITELCTSSIGDGEYFVKSEGRLCNLNSVKGMSKRAHAMSTMGHVIS